MRIQFILGHIVSGHIVSGHIVSGHNVSGRIVSGAAHRAGPDSTLILSVSVYLRKFLGL